MRCRDLRLAMLLLLATGATAHAQPPAAPPRSAAQAIHVLIAASEKQLTGVAEAMPDDKYEFVPTEGAFRGVRSFAKQ